MNRVFLLIFQLDAKNSPLALLAQTCSAIGSDAPNAKLVANMEKSSKAHQHQQQQHNNNINNNISKSENRDKLSPGSHSSSLSNSSSETNQIHHPSAPPPTTAVAAIPTSQLKSSFKPYESAIRDSNRTSPPDDRSSSTSSTRIKTPKGSHTPNGIPINGSSSTGANDRRCGSNQSASSQRGPSPASIRKTPSAVAHDHNSSSPHRASKESASASTHYSAVPSQCSPYYSSSKLSDSTRESSVSYPKSSAAMSTAGLSTSPYYNGYSAPGLPYPMDLMTASALMSPHHAMFKAASMNPYLNYARMKPPPSIPTSGAQQDPMLSGAMCRDPYCTGCTLSPHMMNAAAAAAAAAAAGKQASSPCPAGCTQCDHSNASKSAAYASQLSAAHGSVAAAYAHAQLAALAAASQLPYVCNWIAGDAAYCGKRFGNSDELLQHLRSHTSAMNESMMNPATAAGLPPSHPLFQRTYPTPPLSPLSTLRYHPYGGGGGKQTTPMMPSGLAPPPPQSAMAGMPPSMHHPSLAQYFSPYSLYGPRLGQTHP